MKRTNWVAKCHKLVEDAGCFCDGFYVPTKKPKLLCITNKRPDGNAWGQVVLEGRTWKDVYTALVAVDLSVNAFAGRKMHETPDNRSTVCTMSK